MGQADLPDRGRGLTLIQSQGAGGKPQLTSSQGNGTGGHENDLLPAPAQPHQIRHQAAQPRAVQLAGLRVDEQGGAHLDDNAPGGDQRGRDILTSGAHGKNYTGSAPQGRLLHRIALPPATVPP
jgi:hypothetical protein